MTCPRCNSRATVAHAIRFDADGQLAHVCTSCGWRFSSVGCEVRKPAGGPCNGPASLRCVECSRYVCRAHETSRKSRLCSTCYGRIARLIKAGRPKNGAGDVARHTAERSRPADAGYHSPDWWTR